MAFNWNGDRQENIDIYVMMVGSAVASRLTHDPGSDSSPAWSPDGRQIAFVSTRNQGGIYLVSPLGGPERKLAGLAVNPTYTGTPSWSPDGKFLAVSVGYGEKSDDPDKGAVLLFPVDGSSPPRPILKPQSGKWFVHPTFPRKDAIWLSSSAPV